MVKPQQHLVPAKLLSRLEIEPKKLALWLFSLESHFKGRKWEDFGQKSSEGLIGIAEGLIGFSEGLIGQNKRNTGEGLIGFAEV